jgi:hypothetical protein
VKSGENIMRKTVTKIPHIYVTIIKLKTNVAIHFCHQYFFCKIYGYIPDVMRSSKEKTL